MAHQPHHTLLTWIGFVSWGDIGPLTIYRRPDGRLVVLKKTWPDKPASPKQRTQRQRFADANVEWSQLTPTTRRNWNRAAKRLSLPITGHNLYLSTILTGDIAAAQTVQRQAGLALDL